jgi:hypothetical protein
MIGPITQDQNSHRFADERPFLGVENAADTLSSFMLVAVGICGLLFLWHERTRRGPIRFVEQDEMLPYWAFFGAVALTGLGSTYYHLAPGDARLVWDRLPMAVAFMSLLAAVIAERASVRIGVRLLVPLMTLGVASVLYWPASALLGYEDLRPYFAVQFGSLAAVLAVCMLFPPRYAEGIPLPAAIAIYGIAKVFELYDHQIYELGGWVSGHTLKHVTGAAAVYLLLGSLRHRAPLRSMTSAHQQID